MAGALPKTEASAYGLLLCVSLGCGYALTALTAAVQSARLRAIGGGAPWTTQKVLHALILLAAAARTCFFGIAYTSWRWAEGDLKGARPAPRMAFYVSDELPVTVFFTVYAAVALFWAETSFVASERARFYEDFIRPIESATNAVAYSCLVGLWLLYATRWRDYDYYAPGAYFRGVDILWDESAVTPPLRR